MKRNQWEFEYTASKLADAAKGKKAHHQERLKWWEDQKAKIMTKIKDTGIEVHMPVAELYSNKTRGYGPEITVDATLQRDLSECQGKLIEHDAKVREYDGWIQVLAAHPESRVGLNQDDWLYFFGD